MDFRIVATIGPDVEMLLQSGQELSEVGSHFLRIHNNFTAFKHVVLFVIPIELRHAMYGNPTTRTFLELVDSTDSNIIFSSSRTHPYCQPLVRSGDQNFSDTAVARLVCQTLRRYLVPAMVGMTSFEVRKSQCSFGEPASNCRFAMTLQVARMPDFSQLEVWLKATVGLSLSGWCANKVSLVPDDLTRFTLLLAFLQGITDERLLVQYNVGYSDGFLSDIKALDETELLKTLFSLFRALTFDPVKPGGTTRFAIDWHPNSRSRIDGCLLYRVDVVDFQNNGVRGSGKCRVVFTRVNGRSVALGFTSNHDIEEATLRKRLKGFFSGGR